LLLRSFEATKQGWFWSVDHHGYLTYITEDVAELLGDAPAGLAGRPFSELFSPADLDETGRRTLAFVLSKQSSFTDIGVRASPGGEARYWMLTGTPQFDQSGRFLGYHGSALEITKQRISSENAAQLAKYDALTGLPNRRRMAELLDSCLAGGDYHHRPCGILLIDLDRFKHVNDRLGHPAGDAVLEQVAARLIRIVGDKEKVFRLGGDEFQVVLPQCEDRAVIAALAAEIVTNLSQPYSFEGHRCVIGASIGIAVAPTDGRASTDLIRNADLALYSSKSRGRGCFSFFSTDLLKAAEDRRTLEEDLRDALARGEMSLAYQPIVHARSNQITGVEALIRWTHPTRGPVSPALFIPIAEEAGIVAQLGNWALRQACADAVTWPGKLRVAVNVSPVQFNDALPATVTSALAGSGLPPERLELEITEGVFLSDPAAADAMFTSLKQIGVRLALDDFGTGYSSLGYLRTAPFDKIKIDQTFVREATVAGSRNSAIIAAIVALAEALDMETTAEGIEYMDQLDLIRGLKVSHVQGWVYSKAIASGDLVARLEDGNWTISPSGPATERSDRRAVLRKVGVIDGSRYRSVIMRNLSATGALIDSLPNLPTKAPILMDFGAGQLLYARVVRNTGRHLGILFDKALVDDGKGGLCTGHRVSPYALATLNLPAPGDPDRDIATGTTGVMVSELAARLGIKMAARTPEAAPLGNVDWSFASGKTSVPTLSEMTERYLQSLVGDEQAIENARDALYRSAIPQFGTRGLDQLDAGEMLKWLETTSADSHVPASVDSQRLRKVFGRMWNLAVDLKFVDAESNPLQGSLRLDRRGGGEALLSTEEAQNLLIAARTSANRQLKYIIALLMLTGARTGEILNLAWEHLDLPAAVWRVHVPGTEMVRELALPNTAIRILEHLPTLADCRYAVPNPATRKPYRSLTQSWDVVKTRAQLQHIELDDLRYCDLGEAIWQERLFALLAQHSPGDDERPS